MALAECDKVHPHPSVYSYITVSHNKFQLIPITHQELLIWQPHVVHLFTFPVDGLDSLSCRKSGILRETQEKQIA